MRVVWLLATTSPPYAAALQITPAGLGSNPLQHNTGLDSCSAQYIAGLCPAAGPPSKVSSRQVDRKAMLTTVSALAAILGITVRML